MLIDKAVGLVVGGLALLTSLNACGKESSSPQELDNASGGVAGDSNGLGGGPNEPGGSGGDGAGGRADSNESRGGAGGSGSEPAHGPESEAPGDAGLSAGEGGADDIDLPDDVKPSPEPADAGRGGPMIVERDASVTMGPQPANDLDAGAVSGAGASCPAAIPVAGSTCEFAVGTACYYAGERCLCREVDGGIAWACQETDCPSERPMAGVSCEDGATKLCQYGGAQCACNEMDAWQCRACPLEPPNPGDQCAVSSGQCRYGEGLGCMCSDGTWSCVEQG